MLEDFEQAYLDNLQDRACTAVIALRELMRDPVYAAEAETRLCAINDQVDLLLLDAQS